jgi:hypothetical protein
VLWLAAEGVVAEDLESIVKPEKKKTNPDIKISKSESSENKTNMTTANQNAFVNTVGIEVLNQLLVESMSDQEFYNRADVFYARIPRALVTGALHRSELSALALRLYSSVNPRDLNVAIVLTTELGDPALLRALKNLFEYSQDIDRRLFILEELGRTNFTMTYAIDDLIELSEQDESQFSITLREALVRSGRSEVLEWAETNIRGAAGEDTRLFWIDALKNVSYTAGDESVEALIALSERTSIEDVQYAIYMALGGIGSIKAQRYLYSTLGVMDNSDKSSIIADALSRASTQQSWAQIQDQFLFGENLDHRLVALNGFAIGFERRSMAETLQTLRKIAATGTDGFPPELVQEAERLIVSIAE